MSALLPFLVFDQSCDQVLTLANEQLKRAGFRVVQTFDLQVARLAHPDCPCPHHGATDCNCQMIVLLIYQKKIGPVTLVVHGQDGKTWISLAIPINGHSNQRLETAIRRALVPHRTDIPVSTEVTHETRSTV